MKAEGRVKILLLSFLLSSLDGGQWSGSGCGRFKSNERFPVQIASETGGPQIRCGHCGGDSNPVHFSGEETLS